MYFGSSCALKNPFLSHEGDNEFLWDPRLVWVGKGPSPHSSARSFLRDGCPCPSPGGQEWCRDCLHHSQPQFWAETQQILLKTLGIHCVIVQSSVLVLELGLLHSGEPLRYQGTERGWGWNLSRGNNSLQLLSFLIKHPPQCLGEGNVFSSISDTLIQHCNNNKKMDFIALCFMDHEFN